MRKLVFLNSFVGVFAKAHSCHATHNKGRSLIREDQQRLKHAAYDVVDLEEILKEGLLQREVGAKEIVENINNSSP